MSKTMIIKILLVVSINLIGSIRFTESSLEVELMPGIVSPTKKPINGLETYPDENGVTKDDAFLKLLDEGFTVYEKLKIPGLAEADDLLYDYSEKEKGSRVFFPDFPDIPGIPALSKNETGEGKDNGGEKEDTGDEKDDDEEDDGEDEEKKVSNQETEDEENEEEGDGVKEYNKERTTITEDDDNQRKNVKTLNQVIPVDPDAIKMLDKGEPFISQRINVSAEKVPKIMNVETVNSQPKYNYHSNFNTKKSNGNNNGNTEKDKKIVLLSYGGRYGGKPKSLRPLNPDELKQAMYHHQQQQPIQRNSQQFNLNNERRKQDQINTWNPPSYPPPWTVTNHNKNRNNDLNNESNLRNKPSSDKKSHGSVIDKSKMYETLNGNDDDYHRIVVPTTPSEGDEQASPSPINPQSNSVGTDFFEEHLLSLRSRRHRGKRQVIQSSDHSDIQVTPSPLGLAGLYEGPMVIPLNPSLANFDELYRRLLLQQLSLEGDQPLSYIEENSYFIPEGIRSPPPSPSPSASLRNNFLSTPYHSQSSSSVRPSKAPGYCIHSYPGQPFSCKNSLRYNTPIVHKPGVDEPRRLRDIYLGYLENPLVNQQQTHHVHNPFLDSFTNPASSLFHTHSKVHNHHSSDFEQAMRLIPDEPVTYLQPYGSFTLQPHPNAYDTLDPISLNQYHELVNNLHNQIGLGNPSIMSTDIDITSTMHPKLVSQLTTLAANAANSGPSSSSMSDSYHSKFPSNFGSYHSAGKNKKLGLFGKNRIFGSKTDSKIAQFMNKLSEERDKSRKIRDSEYFKGKIKRSSDPNFHDNLNDRSDKLSPSTSPPSLPSTPGTHQIMASVRSNIDSSQHNQTNINGTSKFQ
ncbi:uncharacterized protein LOC107367068 isoform X2 [Tetranychus urticae]|uniref:uncharacterized protein LOC107367068 isoform X2 n=1 Tax=Tetranychus urticae TaxID=32264 RepID=UPI00077C01F4|nr:uncharacterized protein LOC107367068 isoform X2 [Tetranychus urticae]